MCIRDSDYLDRNVVKAFLDENQNAYDFKRDIYDSDIGGVFRHIGFYGFDRDTLFQFSSLPASKNEIKYSLEQFRALDNGIKINVALAKSSPIGKDTEEDYVAIKKIMENFMIYPITCLMLLMLSFQVILMMP